MMKHKLENHYINIKSIEVVQVDIISQLRNGPTINKTLIGLGLVNKMKLHFIQWIICKHIPFSVVESNFFRLFLTIFNVLLLKYLASNNHTTKHWIMAQFQ